MVRNLFCVLESLCTFKVQSVSQSPNQSINKLKSDIWLTSSFWSFFSTFYLAFQDPLPFKPQEISRHSESTSYIPFSWVSSFFLSAPLNLLVYYLKLFPHPACFTEFFVNSDVLYLQKYRTSRRMGASNRIYETDYTRAVTERIQAKPVWENRSVWNHF
jgi:hypothetical protein